MFTLTTVGSLRQIETIIDLLQCRGATNAETLSRMAQVFDLASTEVVLVDKEEFHLLRRE